MHQHLRKHLQFSMYSGKQRGLGFGRHIMQKLGNWKRRVVVNSSVGRTVHVADWHRQRTSTINKTLFILLPFRDSA